MCCRIDSLCVQQRIDLADHQVSIKSVHYSGPTICRILVATWGFQRLEGGKREAASQWCPFPGLANWWSGVWACVWVCSVCVLHSGRLTAELLAHWVRRACVSWLLHNVPFTQVITPCCSEYFKPIRKQSHVYWLNCYMLWKVCVHTCAVKVGPHSVLTHICHMHF